MQTRVYRFGDDQVHTNGKAKGVGAGYVHLNFARWFCGFFISKFSFFKKFNSGAAHTEASRVCLLSLSLPENFRAGTGHTRILKLLLANTLVTIIEQNV